MPCFYFRVIERNQSNLQKRALSRLIVLGSEPAILAQQPYTVYPKVARDSFQNIAGPRGIYLRRRLYLLYKFVGKRPAERRATVPCGCSADRCLACFLTNRKLWIHYRNEKIHARQQRFIAVSTFRITPGSL